MTADTSPPASRLPDLRDTPLGEISDPAAEAAMERALPGRREVRKPRFQSAI